MGYFLCRSAYLPAVKLMPSSHRLFSLLLLHMRFSQHSLLLLLLPLSLFTPVQLPVLLSLQELLLL
jgi:hypothetical protein